MIAKLEDRIVELENKRVESKPKTTSNKKA